MFLPKEIPSSITSVGISGTIKIRQNGNYVLGSASSDVDISSLAVSANIVGTNSITISIGGTFSGAINNDCASAQIYDFEIRFN